MSDTAAEPGVWFVYDGDCPVCSMAAKALHIQDRYGPLHLIDARENRDSPLIEDIRRRRLDLDEGMVIVFKGRFYHGQDALRFMAQHGDDKGWFNWVNRAFFRSEILARAGYPFMRGIRNLLLRLRGIAKIDNLRDTGEPVFKPIFGTDWDRLPTVMRRHYANRAFRNDIVGVDGILRVESSVLGRFLNPLFRLTGTLVPYEGENVPVTVRFVTDEKSSAFRFDRIFHFPGRPPYRFRSAMISIRDNELIEQMGAGLCWRLSYAWNGEKVVLSHKGYALRIFGLLIPIPLTMLIGRGYAEEVPLDDDAFSMMTEIRHPVWGKVFGYSGTFRLTKNR